MNQPVIIENTPTKKSTKSQWWTALIAFMVFLLVITLFSEEATYDSQIKQQKLALPVVSALKVLPSSYAAKVEALGEVKPRWQTELRSFVRGEVVSVADMALEGRHVKKGQRLITIDNTRYLAQLAEAQNRLAAAKVSLLIAERESLQAKRNWKLSGLKGDPESSLAFKQPQLEAAQAEYTAAKSVVKDATRDLDFTKVTAPFDGIITMRTVNPGETVEAGQPLLTLISNQLLDIPVKLNQKQWQLIVENWQGKAAQLSLPNENLETQKSQNWSAILERVSGHIDPTTRQRTLFLKAEDVDDLMPGSMVRATISGRQFESLLKVPQSAITRDGFIWLIDNQHLLQRSRAEVLFTQADWSFISTPKIATIKQDESNYWRIVLTPLSSYLPGTRVQAEIIKD